MPRAKSVPRSPLFNGDARRCKAHWGATPRTMARPVVPYDEYGQPAWHTARRLMVGASEMAALLGLSPWSSAFSLWWSKQRGWEVPQTLAMQIGHELEPIIGRLFAAHRPDLRVYRANGALWTHPTMTWMGCSPDFLAVNGDMYGGCVWVEPVECKSDEGGREWGEPGTDEIPRHHRVQVLQQCLVFGAPRGHVVRMHGKRFSAYTVEVDDAARVEFGQWAEVAHGFVDSLDGGDPPPLDDHQATTDTLKALIPTVDEHIKAPLSDDLCDRYAAARRTLRDAKSGMRLVTNEMLAMLGGSRYGVRASTGAVVVDRRQYMRRPYPVPATYVDALWPVD